jgi:hypothetical protein
MHLSLRQCAFDRLPADQCLDSDGLGSGIGGEDFALHLVAIHEFDGVRADPASSNTTMPMRRDVVMAV